MPVMANNMNHVASCLIDEVKFLNSSVCNFTQKKFIV